jgi:hypothetical protein
VPGVTDLIGRTLSNIRVAKVYRLISHRHFETG